MNIKFISITKPILKEIENFDSEQLLSYIARVSNPSNQMNTLTSAKLLKYCIKNKHWSVFEHINMTFEITTSLAIATQILRHRSFVFQQFCIAGDSQIRLFQPNGTPYTRSIEHLYNLQSKPNQHIKHKGLPLARVFDGENFISAKIKEVFNTGIKDCFEITLADGKKLKTTKEHKFLTKNGYDTLENIVGLNLNNTKASMSKIGIIATNGLLNYQQKEWLSNQKQISIKNKTGVQGIADVAGVSYHTIRKWLRINKLTFTKDEVLSYTTIWNKGKFGYKNKPHSLETIQKMRASAKKGKDNVLWRGGSDRSERLKIADWCNQYRSEFLINANYKCINCGSSKKLELDHIIPVYKDMSLAYEKSNIQVLCKECHNQKHNLNGDKKIWRQSSKGNTLVVKWQTITNIEYVGKLQTYDMEIDHETHNYVANGIVTHNSGRYSKSNLEFEPIEFRMQDNKNRQNSIEIESNLQSYKLINFKHAIEQLQSTTIQLYNDMLTFGIAKEVARFILPQNTTTTLYMTGNLRSWLHYIELRADKATQKEHRIIAEAIKEILAKEFISLFGADND